MEGESVWVEVLRTSEPRDLRHHHKIMRTCERRFCQMLKGVMWGTESKLHLTGKSNHAGFLRFSPTCPLTIQSQASNIH